MSNDERDQLETWIDRHGLPAVLESLADICHEKADHVESAWQDAPLARAWCKVADAIEHAESAAHAFLP